MNYPSNSYDGSRIANSKNSFEWWYFDIDLSDQYHVHIEWHNPIFNFRDTFNSLIVRIFKHEDIPEEMREIKGNFQKTKGFRYHRSTVFQSEEKCDIRFPSGYIKEEEGNYFMTILEKDLQVNLKMLRVLPPLSVKDDILYRAKTGEHYFAWYVPLPRAVATGEIVVDGKRIEATGLSYHDHNWGNLNLRTYLQGWIWTRILFNDFTFIFGDITPRISEERSQVLLFVDREGRKVNPECLKIDYDEFDNHNQFGIQAPRTFSIQFADQDNYRILVQREHNFVTAEAPFGSFKSNFLNLWLVKSYYVLQFYRAPNVFRKRLGRLVYFQAEIAGELYCNNHLKERKMGNIEVISFAE